MEKFIFIINNKYSLCHLNSAKQPTLPSYESKRRLLSSLFQLLISFNPQHLLGDAATTDIRRHQSTNDCTTWQDLAFA